MVYQNVQQFHPVHRHQAHDMKCKKRVSKMQKILRTLPIPSVEMTFAYCPYCNSFRHLRFEKLFLGNIEVSTSCCGDVLGYLDYPDSVRTHKDRKIYLAWLNQ